MTEQHPLNDELIIQLIGDKNLFYCLTEDDMRAAADWQLAQVLLWLLFNINDRYERGLENNLPTYKITDDIIDELEVAMRPQQQEDN